MRTSIDSFPTKLRQLPGAVVMSGALLLAACSGGEEPGLREIIGSSTPAVADQDIEGDAAKLADTPETTTTTEAPTEEDAQALIDNIYNTPATNEFLCAVDGLATGTLEYVRVEGEVIPTQTLGTDLKVDATERSQDSRVESNNLANAIEADLTDVDAVKAEFFTTLCNHPDVLSAYLVLEANLPYGEGVVGDRVEWLSEYVGLTTEDIQAVTEALRIPHNDAQLSDEQAEENEAANNKRIELAERLVTALSNKEASIRLATQVESTVAYEMINGVYGTEEGEAPNFVDTGAYTGDVLLFDATDKTRECVTLQSGINLKAQGTVQVITINNCEAVEVPVEITTTTTEAPVVTTTTPTKPTTSTTEAPTTTTTTEKPAESTTTTLGNKGDESTATTVVLAPPTTEESERPATQPTIIDELEEDLAPADTVPGNVTPTTHDVAPVPSTKQEVDETPITAAPPTTSAPVATTPTTDAPANSGQVESI